MSERKPGWYWVKDPDGSNEWCPEEWQESMPGHGQWVDALPLMRNMKGQT